MPINASPSQAGPDRPNPLGDLGRALDLIDLTTRPGQGRPRLRQPEWEWYQAATELHQHYHNVIESCREVINEIVSNIAQIERRLDENNLPRPPEDATLRLRDIRVDAYGDAPSAGQPITLRMLHVPTGQTVDCEGASYLAAFEAGLVQLAKLRATTQEPNGDA